MTSQLQRQGGHLAVMMSLLLSIAVSAHAQLPSFLNPIPQPPCCFHLPEPPIPIQQLPNPIQQLPNPIQQLLPDPTGFPTSLGQGTQKSRSNIQNPSAVPSLPAPIDGLLVEFDKRVLQPIGRDIDHLGRQLDVIGRAKDAANDVVHNAGDEADKTLGKAQDVLEDFELRLEKLVFKAVVGLFILLTCGGGFLMLLHRLLSPSRRSFSA